MTLEEILAKIEDETVKDAVVSTIKAETELGKSATAKKDKENLKLKAKLKETGWDSEKFDTWEKFIESNKAVVEKGNTAELTISQLSDKVTDLSEKLLKSEKETEKAAKSAKENKLKAKLTDAIGDKFYGAEYLIKDLITTGRVDVVDGKAVFKDGESAVDFDKGIANLKEENKSMLKSGIKPGSGDAGGDTPPQEGDIEARLKKAREKLLA